LSIITPAIKAALMYKNRSIKKVVEKTQRRQGTKSMGQKEETQPKTRLQLKRQMEKGFHGGRGWARGRGRKTSS